MRGVVVRLDPERDHCWVRHPDPIVEADLLLVPLAALAVADRGRLAPDVVLEFDVIEEALRGPVAVNARIVELT
jgi:hypothetical protein